VFSLFGLLDQQKDSFERMYTTCKVERMNEGCEHLKLL